VHRPGGRLDLPRDDRLPIRGHPAGLASASAGGSMTRRVADVVSCLRDLRRDGGTRCLAHPLLHSIRQWHRAPGRFVNTARLTNSVQMVAALPRRSSPASSRCDDPPLSTRTRAWPARLARATGQRSVAEGQTSTTAHAASQRDSEPAKQTRRSGRGERCHCATRVRRPARVPAGTRSATGAN